MHSDHACSLVLNIFLVIGGSAPIWAALHEMQQSKYGKV